jgi:hypothetical protein
MKMKPGYRLRREGDQVPTRLTTVEEIMSSPMFALGVADTRAGRGYAADYELWLDSNLRWDYERGRQWAQLAPRHIKLKVGGKITAEAVNLFVKHRGDIR